MKCTFCGEEIAAGAKFCPNCGTAAPMDGNDQKSTDDSQSGGDFGYGYGTSNGNDYGQSDVNQGYGYGEFGQSQESGSGQSGDNQGYGYGQSDAGQGYGCGQSDAGQGYGYGQSGDNQGYNYGPAGGNAGMNNQQMNGYPNQQGTPGKPISGTPYLIFSILTTLCCCLPLGIAAIIYSSKIKTLQNQGDYAGAKNAAKKARLFCIIGAVGGFIASIGLGVSGTLDVLDESEFDSVVESFDDDDDDYYDDEVSESDEVKKNDAVGSVEAPEGAWNEFKIVIDGKELAFPCTPSDVEAAGLELEDEDEVRNRMVNAGEYELVFYENEVDDYLMFMLCNDTDGPIEVLDCQVKGVYLADYNVEGGLSVVFPGGVQVGADISTAVDKWGEPSDIYEGEGTDSYSWYDDDYNYCTISVNHDTGKIESIDLDGSGL